MSELKLHGRYCDVGELRMKCKWGDKDCPIIEVRKKALKIEWFLWDEDGGLVMKGTEEEIKDRLWEEARDYGTPRNWIVNDGEDATLREVGRDNLE